MTRSEPDREADFAASCLRMIGYDVCPVPRTIRPGGSCDLEATRGPERLLIEVKTWKTPAAAAALLAEGEAAALGARIDRRCGIEVSFAVQPQVRLRTSVIPRDGVRLGRAFSGRGAGEGGRPSLA